MPHNRSANFFVRISYFGDLLIFYAVADERFHFFAPMRSCICIEVESRNREAFLLLLIVADAESLYGNNPTNVFFSASSVKISFTDSLYALACCLPSVCVGDVLMSCIVSSAWPRNKMKPPLAFAAARHRFPMRTLGKFVELGLEFLCHILQSQNFVLHVIDPFKCSLIERSVIIFYRLLQFRALIDNGDKIKQIHRNILFVFPPRVVHLFLQLLIRGGVFEKFVIFAHRLSDWRA
jgi:hypothetical protein